ncbi:uncharacterized protein LOC127652393 isoform X2 [Xyrauchen texanus]|uniref:uncharacterized protein LOC127652393 isoform X2 n=1 Tax=Xyrauchen texanus TaxID=154827 RepID=UPI0022428CA4|nr:uncharacterized protein LOC127652393 isoform X2 [Xyrauchen texanus]
MDEQSDTDSNSKSGSEWEADSTESSSGSDWLGENCKRKKAQRGQKRKMKTRSCKEIDSSQSVGHTIKDKSQLPITCGDKEGVLYLDKFDNAEKCILSEEQWFKPTEFEKFGGKGKNKKWKISILCNGIPVQKLIEDGFLLSPNFKKSRVQNGQSNSPESSVVTGRLRRRECRTELWPSNRSDDQSSESDGMDKVHYEDDNHSDEDEDDDDNDVDDDDVIDMAIFEGPTLPVTCGSDSGILHKYRFALGHCGKCIRTEDLWLTPEDFIRLKKPEGTWRKDIVSHGVPLGQLIMKRVLILHLINCGCDICQNLDQYANDDVCYMCNSEEELVCCDECPRAFHPDCHLPTVDNNSPGSQWSCTFCVMKKMVSSQMPQQDFLSSPFSHYRLYCQYLLLYLLHESTTDPFTKVPGCSEDISGPRMLGRAKLNLKNNDYQTVGDFVTDIEDVFQHCTSNRVWSRDICNTTLKQEDQRSTLAVWGSRNCQELLENTGECIYEVLESIEKNGKEHVRRFWKCVNQKHILETYHLLSKLTEELWNSLEGRSLRNAAEQSKPRDAGKNREVKKRRTESNCASNQAGPSSQDTNSQWKTSEHVNRALDSHLLGNTGERSKEQNAGKGRYSKKRRTESNCESNQAGPSTQSTNSQRKTTEHVEKEGQKNLWDMPKYKQWLPVTCGKEKASLDRNALFDRKRECIKHRGIIITPYVFEKLGGKGSCKNWKTSILCQGITLNNLIERGELKIPQCEGKFTLRK